MLFITFFLALLVLHTCAEALPPESSGSPSAKLNLSQQLTVDLSSEICPSLSPDGRWLLYASNRTGTYDLWVRPAAGGIPTQLTSHPADDYSPAWSPNGRKICFVSTRDDPQGDLYILNFSVRSGKPRAARIRLLLEDAGFQDSPSFSPDGKFIAFRDGTGSRSRIALLRLGRKNKTWLTGEGYLQPAFSPVSGDILCIQFEDETGASDICLIEPGEFKSPDPHLSTVYSGSFPAATPRWSPDGNSFIAALVNRDKNRDGHLTAQDGQALYRFDRQDQDFKFRTISIGIAGEMYPFWGEDGYIYFSSDVRGNLDLWRILDEGPIPPADSVVAAIQLANRIGREAEIRNRPLTRREILLKLLAFDRVRQDFPEDRHAGAISMLESSRLLASAGAAQRSLSFLIRIPRLYPAETSLRAEAEIDYQLYAHRAQTLPDGQITCTNPASLITNLDRIIYIYPRQMMSAARALYLIGQAHEQIGDLEQSLAIYRSIIENYPEAGDHPANALLRVAAVYSMYGIGDEALAAYLDEISHFSDRTDPTEKAISSVIDARVSRDNPIAGLQDLIGRYPELPALAAAAQLRIAQILAQAGESDLALSEYERLRGFAIRHPIPYVETLFVRALIASARLEETRGEVSMPGMLGSSACACSQTGLKS
jgi:Tol biopolymer transport system component